MSALLEIEDLTIHYRLAEGASFTALNAHSLTLARGEVLGVVGQSGAGKSTVGKAILGLLEENARITSGRILLDGQDIRRQGARAQEALRGRRIGYIYQNPMTALDPVLTIGEQLLESIRAHTDKRGAAARAYAIELLTQAEVPQPESRLSKYPHQLSGGLCQRIVFAIAICARPDLLIADEPTTALDVTVQKAVLGTLERLARREGIAILLITHDMGVVAQMCDRVQVLRQGQLVEEGETRQMLTAPTQPYTQQLIASIPPMDRRIERFDVLEQQQETEGRARGLAYLKAGIAETPGGDKAGPLLSVASLSKTYAPDRATPGAAPFQALRDVGFEVRPGEALGIVGESGSGKSTIGRCILRLQQPDAGAEIRFAGRDIASYRGRAGTRALTGALAMHLPGSLFLAQPAHVGGAQHHLCADRARRSGPGRGAGSWRAI